MCNTSFLTTIIPISVVFKEDESELVSDFDVEYEKANISLMITWTYAKERVKQLFYLEKY
jgi:hypothetical protein